MLNITQIAAIIVGPRIPTAIHRIGRLLGFLSRREISFGSFLCGLRPNQVTVSSTSGAMLGLDRALDRMISQASNDDIIVVYRGAWMLGHWSLTWCRPIIGRDSEGNFHPGVESDDTSGWVRMEWLAPYVSFAASWRVARQQADYRYRRMARPFGGL